MIPDRTDFRSLLYELWNTAADLSRRYPTSLVGRWSTHARNIFTLSQETLLRFNVDHLNWRKSISHKRYLYSDRTTFNRGDKVSKDLSKLSALLLIIAIALSEVSSLSVHTVQAVPGSGVNGAVNHPVTAPPTSVDLSTYIRIGRFDLPEPTRTPAPANSLLAQEVSAVTYNWDTDTLFVVGDGGTSVVQVSKTGQLIDSMTLAPGSSPQGTDFFDPEGLTYVGNGKFVMSEERDRQAVLFTYVAGTTLHRADAQTVKLGTFVQNIGIEGISFDPLTAGYIAVKETQPQGIFQTGIDFAAGTATNGSPTTENSVNLFDPALLNLLDLADVYAMSNLSTLTGRPDL